MTRENARPVGHGGILFSVLRPLRGSHEDLEDNLRDGFELCGQSHELLFAAEHAEDDGLALARAMAERRARVRWRALVAGPPVCPNAKVHSLDVMTGVARGDVLVIVDSDVQCGREMLDALAAEFGNAQVGVVTCPYRAVAGRSPWSGLEALGMNTEFWGGVLVAQFLSPMDFAVGPAMAIRRSCLDDLGGWARVAEYLAEDFRLGKLARGAGWDVRLSSHVVEHRIGSAQFRDNLSHRLRWRRSTKRSRPVAYWGEVFTNPLPWALALVIAVPGEAWAWMLLGTCGALRLAAAQAVSGGVLGQRLTLRRMGMLPAQDMLSLLTWAGGLAGRRIRWGGRLFELLSDGRMRTVGE